MILYPLVQFFEWFPEFTHMGNALAQRPIQNLLELKRFDRMPSPPIYTMWLVEPFQFLKSTQQI